MIKVSIHQEYTRFIDIYAHNVGVSKYIKQILIDLKREMNGNTIIVGDFNISISLMDWSSRQKVNKETLALNDLTPDRFNRHLQKIPPQQQNTILPECIWIDYMLSHKTSCNRFRGLISY